MWHQRIPQENIVMDACLLLIARLLPSFCSTLHFLFIYLFFAAKSWEQTYNLRGGCWMTVLVQLHTALCLGLVSVLPAVVYEFTWNCLKSKFSSIMLCRDSPSLSSVTRSSASLTSVARWHTCEESKGMGGKRREEKASAWGQAQMSWCLSPKLCYDKS